MGVLRPSRSPASDEVGKPGGSAIRLVSSFLLSAFCFPSEGEFDGKRRTISMFGEPSA